MYEVVKTVNGIDIIRMKGTRKAYYHIYIDEHRQVWFKTIKAAVEWIERR